MPGKDTVPRTVQYWRLVDARTGDRMADLDWDLILSQFHATRTAHVVDGREQAGTSHLLSVHKADWQTALSTAGMLNIVQPANPNATYGLVLASVKDYVPNQGERASGSQKAMQLDSNGWDPVDNLFVWFLPFGNIFGVLAESVSSSRAATFVDWLNKATVGQFQDPDLIFAAKPVIDQARAQMLQNADGLRAVAYAGEIGSAVQDASGLAALFGGGLNRTPGALRLEIKATLVRGKSAHGDEQLILDWFNTNFGSLQGAVEKAQVTVEANQATPVTEIDLLHHRLTRKRNVPIATGSTRAFTPLSAVGSILDAFVLDRDDLYRLRDSDD